MKICLVLSFVFLTSCFKFGGNKITDSRGGLSNNAKSNFPTKGIIDLRTFIDIDISNNISDGENLTLKTRTGRILYSGPAYSLRRKSGIQIPYKLEAIIVSIGGDKNQKIVKVTSKLLKVGY